MSSWRTRNKLTAIKDLFAFERSFISWIRKNITGLVFGCTCLLAAKDSLGWEEDWIWDHLLWYFLQRWVFLTQFCRHRRIECDGCQKGENSTLWCIVRKRALAKGLSFNTNMRTRVTSIAVIATPFWGKAWRTCNIWLNWYLNNDSLYPSHWHSYF